MVILLEKFDRNLYILFLFLFVGIIALAGARAEEDFFSHTSVTGEGVLNASNTETIWFDQGNAMTVHVEYFKGGIVIDISAMIK
jgi:hypothetical protein